MGAERLGGDQALKTYRYLRIGLIGAAVMIAISVLLERRLVDCWQNSISGYYYTPARAVFVGALVAIGISLIVIKGRGIEDFHLNIAGMLAPVVAFVPTRNVGVCWSVPPEPAPVVTAVGQGVVFADWVIQNIQNNMWALIITGALGLVVAYIIFSVDQGGAVEAMRGDQLEPGVKRTYWMLVAIVVASTLAFWLWDGFVSNAHDIAAIGMFTFLAMASWTNGRREESTWYRSLYFTVAVLMIAAVVVVIGLAIVLGERWEHPILVLEFIEIGLFAVYWSAQTREHWHEAVTQAAG
jgi:hypothetical protein